MLPAYLVLCNTVRCGGYPQVASDGLIWSRVFRSYSVKIRHEMIRSQPLLTFRVATTMPPTVSLLCKARLVVEKRMGSSANAPQRMRFPDRPEIGPSPNMEGFWKISRSKEMGSNGEMPTLEHWKVVSFLDPSQSHMRHHLHKR